MTARVDAVTVALDAAKHSPGGNPGWTIRLSDDEYAAARAQHAANVAEIETAEETIAAALKLLDACRPQLSDPDAPGVDPFFPALCRFNRAVTAYRAARAKAAK